MKAIKTVFFAVLMAFMLLIETESNAAIRLIPNVGQWDGDFIARADIPGGILYVQKTGLLYYFFDKKALQDFYHDHKEISGIRTHIVKVNFRNADLPEISSENIKNGAEIYNFFNSRGSFSRINALQKLSLKEIWPHIDLELLPGEDDLKYNIIVHKGGKVSSIRIDYTGQNSIEIKDSMLYIRTDLSQWIEQAPLTYQAQQATKKEIECKYILKGNEVGFDVDGYDHSQDLIIDPRLIFATFSGSTADNFGFTATFDKDGNGDSGGHVYAVGFPAKSGVGAGFQTNWAGGKSLDAQDFGIDAGILKYSTDGKQLLWASYLGGSGNEQPHSMVVDKNNDLIVLGTTSSTNFPGLNGSSNQGAYDIFLSKISPDGSTLIKSRLFGGSGEDGINGGGAYAHARGGQLTQNYGDPFRGEVIVDSTNNIIFTSCTQSSNYPIINAFQTSLSGKQDACITKIDDALIKVYFSTYFGGSGEDAGYGVNIDRLGHIFIAGGTQGGISLPNATNQYHGGIDGFLAKLDSQGKSVMNYVYVGTDKYDQAYFVQTDETGRIFTTGQTLGSFPVTGKVYSVSEGKQFIAVYDNDLKNLKLSTTFGATGADNKLINLSPSAFLVDLCGRVCVSGWGGEVNRYISLDNGTTRNLPITSDAYQSKTDGSDFYLIVFSRNLEKLTYATYFGGLKTDEHVDGGTSRFDYTGKVYQAICGGCGGFSDMPTTEGAWSRKNKGKRPNNPLEGGCNNALFKADLNSSNFAPVLKDTAVTISATDLLNLNIEATDADAGDSVIISIKSSIFDSKQTNGKPGYYSIYNGISRGSAHVLWQTDCGSGDSAIIEVTARDNGCPIPRSTTRRIIIHILPLDPPPFPGIFCLKRLNPNTIKIFWDDISADKSVKEFVLVKHNPDNSESVLKRFTSKDSRSFTDNSAIDHQHIDYCYFIYGVNVCGKIGDSTRRICSIPDKDSIPKAVYVHQVSVINDRDVEIKWFRNPRPDFSRYFLYRKKNDTREQFTLIAEIKNSVDTVFRDSSADVHTTSYQYRLITNTQCGVSGPLGNIGTSILLEGSAQPYVNSLHWNEYKTWEDNVDHYDIYRRDTGSAFAFVGSSKSTDFTDTSLNIDWGLFHYRIVGIEGSTGYSGQSVSNEIKLFQKPLITPPNAFTPNSDELNDQFGVFPVFVKDFHLKIFNRWGEKVFETYNKHQGWDGTYRGNAQFNNVYIWQADYTGFDGSENFRQGNVTTLK